MTLPEYDPNLAARYNVAAPPDGDVRHYGNYGTHWTAMCGRTATYFSDDWRLVNCAECRKPAEPAVDVNKHLRRTTWSDLAAGVIGAVTAVGDTLAECRDRLNPDLDKITLTGHPSEKARAHWTLADRLLVGILDGLQQAKQEMQEAADDLAQPAPILHLIHPTFPGALGLARGNHPVRACDRDQPWDETPGRTEETHNLCRDCQNVVESCISIRTAYDLTPDVMPLVGIDVDPADLAVDITPSRLRRGGHHPTSLPLVGHVSWCMATTPTGEVLPLAGSTHHICRQPDGHFLTGLHLCDVCGHTWPIETTPPATPVTPTPLPTLITTAPPGFYAAELTDDQPRHITALRLLTGWCSNFNPHPAHDRCEGINPNTIYTRIPN